MKTTNIFRTGLIVACPVKSSFLGYFFGIIFYQIATIAVSQNIGINTTGAAPKTSALLDIDDGGSNDKGLLIPRVALTDVNTYSPISGVNVESLIIYDSLGTATGSNGKGYYYWNGTKWFNIPAPSNGPGTSGQVLASQGSGNPPAWQSVVGGGGITNRMRFGSYSRAIDPADQIGYGQAEVIVPYEALAYNAFSNGVNSAVLTHSSTKEFRGERPIDFNGKLAGKMTIQVNLSVMAEWSTNVIRDIQLNATNTKIEVLDGATVKATWVLAGAVKSNSNSSTQKGLTYSVMYITDFNGYAFTDFRIKVYIESTVSTTTNLLFHYHYYFGLAQSEDYSVGISDNSGVVEIELK